MNILTIDVGFVNPGFVLVCYSDKLLFQIYQNLRVKKITDLLPYLRKIAQKKLDLVLIEKQCSEKNSCCMRFIQGFFEGKDIPVEIKNPIAYELGSRNTRKVKKQYSVDKLNSFLLENKVKLMFEIEDADYCDAINICLKYLETRKKNITGIPVEIRFISL